MSAMHARFQALTVMLAILSIAPCGQAAMMLHYDLSSLVSMSDAVVLAEHGQERKLTPYVSATTYKIKKVYMGTLAAGKSIEILDDGYSMDHPLSLDVALPAPDKDRVLFIGKIDAAGLPTDLKKSNPPSWSVVPSGMRIMISGQVYRFEQFSNPGLYQPTPQGRDPYDVRDELPVAVGVSLATFEADLEKAMERAKAFSGALKQTDKSKRNAQLLEVLAACDPIHPLTPYRYGFHGFFADAIGQDVLELFHKEGDMQDLLAAAWMIGRPGQNLWLHDLDAQALTAYAENGSHPDGHRLAALMLILWEQDWKDDGVFLRLAELVKDGSPEIAEAAVLIMEHATRTTFYDKGKKPKVLGKKHAKVVRENLLEAFEKTSDPFLRAAIASAAGAFGLKKALVKKTGTPALFFAAEGSGGFIRYRFVYLSKNPLSLESLIGKSKQGPALVGTKLEIVEASYGAFHGSGLAKAKGGTPVVRVKAVFKDHVSKKTHEVEMKMIEGHRLPPYPETTWRCGRNCLNEFQRGIN
jgi:hypothetical protein